MVQIAVPSIFTKLALIASSIALPFLLICWVTVRDLELKKRSSDALLVFVVLIACLIGVTAILFMILHVSSKAGITFGVASLAAMTFGYSYEMRYKKKQH